MADGSKLITFSQEDTQELAQMTIDRGAAFLGGQAASAFEKITSEGATFTQEEANAYNYKLKGALHRGTDRQKDHIELTEKYRNKKSLDYIDSYYIYRLNEELIYNYNIQLDGAEKYKKDTTPADKVQIWEQHESLPGAIPYYMGSGIELTIPTHIINLYNSKLQYAKHEGDTNIYDPKNIYKNLTKLFTEGSQLYDFGLEMFEGKEEILQDLISLIVKKITEACGTLISKEVQKVSSEIQKIPSSFLNVTQKETQKNLISMDDLLRGLNAEDPQTENLDDLQKKSQAQIDETTKKARDKIEKISSTINETAERITGKMVLILRYAEEGQDYINEQLEKYANLGFSGAEEWADKQVDDLIKYINTQVEFYGKKVGKAAADKINNLILTTILKNQNLIATNAKSILIKVEQVKLSAILLVMQKLGLNV